MAEAAGPRGSERPSRTIGEVADELHVPQHVLRFWETRFPDIKPMKRAGGRRLYRPEDVALLRAVQTLLYAEGYTIKGVQRLLAEFGALHVADALARSTSKAAGRDGPDRAPQRLVQQDVREPEPSARAGDTMVAAPTTSPRLPIDVAERLRAALDDLSDCLRLLASVDAPRD